jgi:hypothetical protein
MVRDMQVVALERSKFRGFSGTARMLGAIAAFAGATILDSPLIPRTPLAHLAGWAAVLVAGLSLNFGALALWFCRRSGAARDALKLLPAADALPALMAGALLSAALIIRGQYDMLFGVWMILYGIAHAPYRRTLPPAVLIVGAFYALSGAVCLLHPAISFLNPWPMGLVFFTGEAAGGYILFKHRLEELP